MTKRHFAMCAGAALVVFQSGHAMASEQAHRQITTSAADRMQPVENSVAHGIGDDFRHVFCACLGRDAACISHWRPEASATGSTIARSCEAYRRAFSGTSGSTGTAPAPDELDYTLITRFYELTEAIAAAQATSAASGQDRADTGADDAVDTTAALRSFEPIDGKILDACEQWSGQFRSETHLYVPETDPPRSPTTITASLKCDDADTQTEQQCSGTVTLSMIGGPGGLGTGLYLQIAPVAVTVRNAVLRFEGIAPGDEAADEGKPLQSVLFAALYDCRAQTGILQWGSLAPYDH